VEAASQPRVFAFSVVAGGAGKTQGVVNTAVELANRGYRVLVWDMDPQRTASHILGYQDPPEPGEKGPKTIFDVLKGTAKLLEAVVPARYRIGDGEDDSAFRVIDNIELVHGTLEMADAEVTLGQDPAGVLWLQNVIDEQVPDGRWDAFVIDCGPTLGILLLSIAMINPEIVGCVADEFKYIIGLQDLETALEKGRRKFRRFGFRARVHHVLATNIPIKKDGSINRSGGAVTDDAMTAIRNHEEWSEMLLPIIRRNIRFKDTIVRQRPLRFLHPTNEALGDIASAVDALNMPRLNSTRRRKS
jgi:cellulose biosynthesis protein BcsQ